MTRSAPVAFRNSFDCLWCGSAHTVRSADDIEGWAQLCPECVGRAGDNPFLRFRLRSALEDRAAARAKAPHPAAAVGTDDWYLRRGDFAHGPVHDAAWNAELDAAGRWLDALPFGGRIVELATGSGWWSPLLAGRGELTAYDADSAALDRARERLVAHRLRAHLHVRDPRAAPEGPPADALFLGFVLAGLAAPDVDGHLARARRWLRPGGLLAAMDVLPDPAAGRRDATSPAGTRPAVPSGGRTGHGSEADDLATALRRAGFGDIEVASTGRFFLLARATA